jgi:asparagine synthase (glutamine-hydrolysing)
MCGLFASIGFPPDPGRIDLVSHRGPDGRGWQVIDTPAGPVALGHRRLAIIDTSDAGLQPLADETGRFRVILNGEIYNYRELRRELEAEGCRFRTATDTEVLLQAFIRWGEAALPRFVGMFAFVLWDGREQRLFAARDRYGIKPLYLAQGGGGLALASEIKQLLGLPGVGARANRERLRDFLAFGIIDHTEETQFEGVTQLRGGECLRVDCRGGRPGFEVKRWHEPVPPREQRLSKTEAAERFRALFDDSMRLHLRADVRVGSCLSGGLDSSSVVVTASGLLTSEAERRRFTTISAVYPGTEVDEGAFAAAVNAHTGLAGVTVTPTAADLLDNLDGIVRAQDEPFGSTSILSQWAVFQAARREGIKVMLDGQGADEVLAGYRWMIGQRMLELLKAGRLPALARTLADRLPEDVGRRGKLAFLKGDMLALARQAAPHGLRARAKRRVQQAADGDWLLGRPASAEAEAARRLGLAPPASLADQRFLLTQATNLPMLLHWEDRNSMIHGIEARVPFLDHRLVDFSLSLAGDNLFDGALTKTVLRDAMADRLPPVVRDRRDKLGFATPEGDWLRGALRPAVEEGVEAAISHFPDVFEPAATRGLRDTRLGAEGPLDFTLWRIANTGLWARAFGVG